VRGLIFHGVGDVRVESLPDPTIEAPGDALVRVERAAICGSDLHPYRGREQGLDPGTVMGHELLGEVVAVGREVSRIAVGDRVVSAFTTSCGTCPVCRSGLTSRCPRGQLLGWRQGGVGLHGAQAELVRIPLADGSLVTLPDDGADPEPFLFLADILPTGWFAAELAEVRPGAVAVVLGCGPVGLMAVLAARARGAERVFAVDRVAERLALGVTFGATALDLVAGDATAQVAEATGGRGADCVLEAVGSPEASRMALTLVRDGGTIGAVGVHTEPAFAFTPGEAYDRNLTYRAGRCPARRFMDELLPVAAAHRPLLTSLVSHRLPLADGPAGYRLFDERRDGCTKVVLTP
jgi:threonine dehydrogenase-like Zn-dependent dehydrogenase